MDTAHTDKKIRKLEITVLLLFVATLIAAVLISPANSRKAFVSGEVQYTDSSHGGLEILPASCASNPSYYHYLLTPTADAYGYILTPGHTENGIYRNSVYLCASNTSGSDVAASKPGSASTSNGSYPPSYALNRDYSSFWESAGAVPQWIQVDLEQSQTLALVVLAWDSLSYGIAYEVQTSTDGSNWTTQFSTTAGDGGTDEIQIPYVSGRYVRVYVTAASMGGNSSQVVRLKELVVVGGADLLAFFIPAKTAAEMNAVKAVGSSIQGLQVW
jgi:hypothetical protein